jgi:hypothetical protein
MRTVALLLALVAGGARVEPATAEPATGARVEIPERVELVAGAGGTLSIAVTLDRGLTVSRDADVILDLAPDSAIAIKRRRLRRADAVDPAADAPRFAIALRADTAGDFRMRVHLRFWVCGTKVCKPVDARRNVAIAVAAPPPAPTPPPASPPPTPPATR